jgi:molybdenum cofactor cytidylyltransferase
VSVAGIVMAGGESRRLGQPKQNLPYRGMTLLERAVVEAEAVLELDPIVVVLPPGDAVPAPATARARVVRRAEGDGCSASLRAALDVIPEQAEAIAVVPVDQVHLTRELIGLAVRAWLERRPPGLALASGEKASHPFIYDGSLREQLLALRGERGMWRLLESLGEDVVRIEIPGDLTRDVDSWEDYVRLGAEGEPGT